MKQGPRRSTRHMFSRIHTLVESHGDLMQPHVVRIDSCGRLPKIVDGVICLDESTLADDKRHRINIVEDDEAMLVTFKILQVCSDRIALLRQKEASNHAFFAPVPNARIAPWLQSSGENVHIALPIPKNLAICCYWSPL